MSAVGLHAFQGWFGSCVGVGGICRLLSVFMIPNFVLDHVGAYGGDCVHLCLYVRVLMCTCGDCVCVCVCAHVVAKNV